MSFEGGIIRLSWEQVGDGYRAWPLRRPDLAVEAATWAAVEMRLIDTVSVHLAHGEWTAEWFPPPPAPTGTLRTSDTFVMLRPEGGALVLSPLESLFAGGVCSTCGSYLGVRTPVELTIGVIESGNMLATENVPASLCLCSESFVNVLSVAQRECTEFRSCGRVSKGPTKISYREALPRWILPPVAIKGLLPSGRSCTACGTQQLHYLSPTIPATLFVAERNLPDRAEAFWVGHPAEPRLCVRFEWWRNVRMSQYCRGIVAEPLGLVSAEDIDPSPALQAFPAVARIKKKLRLRQRRLAAAYGYEMPHVAPQS